MPNHFRYTIGAYQKFDLQNAWIIFKTFICQWSIFSMASTVDITHDDHHIIDRWSKCWSPVDRWVSWWLLHNRWETGKLNSPNNQQCEATVGGYFQIERWVGLWSRKLSHNACLQCRQESSAPRLYRTECVNGLIRQQTMDGCLISKPHFWE